MRRKKEDGEAKEEEEERRKQQEEQDRIAGPIPDIFRLRNRNSDGEILSDDGTVITRENLREKGIFKKIIKTNQKIIIEIKDIREE